jgi:hypothetical protein
MKKEVGIFIFLFFLFSACETPAATKPVVQAQRTQTPSPITTLTPSLRPTSTLNVYNQEEINRGGNRFCQVGPESAQFGSTVNVSVFGMPPNVNVSIYVFPHEESANTFMTDSNGYLNADLMIPMNADLEWNMVIVNGTDATIECFVWVWSEEYLPTYYAGLTKTLTPTLSPQQVVLTATQQALNDRLGANCTYGSAQAIRLSPNGAWAEAICGNDSIIVIRTNRTKEWSLSSDTLIGLDREDFVHVSHWSNDGAYAYINVNPHTDGYWESFHQGMVLYRLNLESGEISEVLPRGKSERIYYSFSFSPNDRRLAYIKTDQSPVILHIRDIQIGTEQSYEFDPKYNTGGRFVWSPDSEKVVFSIRQFDTNRYEQVATSIVLWEKEKSKTTILLKDHQKNLVPIEWVNDTKIVLQVQYEDDTKFEFDLINNELKQMSP